MTFVVGLTGGIASGKTTVANLFNERYGIDIVDADLIAREVVEPGTEGLKAIEKKFGSQVLMADGSLDRKALRERVFSHSEDKEWLNNLLHPMIHQRMLTNLHRAESPYVLLVAPLLIENNLQSMVNRILVVDTDIKLQIMRTMERDNVSQAQAETILASQVDRTARLENADDVVINSTDIEKLWPQITELHQKYLAISEEDR
ncbi:dephospho-CoA kinase [Vibrio marisflavi]|uniref:Dephospho-CoA kinase n=1 Tax=Vibrio marisflavi CECT 7928 TaxID=634439 RepID=A0ABN8E3U2_9VIBR|nr:dephospho-CoA kinase [Vibrio marisflavi]CAH0538662.1 Dephospho-CoA kinase [Vibrio marisflavi CECT 7928]